MRPNERFSGKGHKNHVCKDCQKLPKEHRERIEIQEELYRFLGQSRISEKNRLRLRQLSEHSDARIREVATLLGEVAIIAEGKRRRWRRVREGDYELYLRCDRAGLTAVPY